MFEYTPYYESIRTDEDKVATRPELLSIHFGRLSGYRNPDWNIQKILLFEYLLLCYRKYGDKFTRTFSLIEQETRLSRNSIIKYQKMFESAGFISIHRQTTKKAGSDFMNRYSINFDHIMDSLNQIYDFEGQSEEDIAVNVEFLKERYKYIRDHPYNRDRQNSYLEQNEDE